MTLELPKAKSKMRTLAAADVIAHWKMEETSGTAIVDATGASNLTGTSSADIVAGPFYGATNNKGRAFAATSSASGASSAGQKTALLGDRVTCTVWFRPNAFAGLGTLIGHLAAGETQVTNALMQMSTTTSGEMRWIWERGLGVNKTQTTTGLGLVVGQLHMLTVRRRPPVSGTANKCDVDLFKDGLLFQTWANEDLPDGGGSGAWVTGATAGGGEAFDGTIYEVRVDAVALSDEGIRESYSRGVRDWDMQRLIDSGEYAVHTRALVRDTSGVWRDQSDLYDVNFIDGFEDGADIDSDGANGKLMLRRRSGFLSLAPFMLASRINLADPAGQLLDISRRVKIEEAYVPRGGSRAVVADVHWQLVFDGFARVVDSTDESLTLTLSGLERALQIAWCQPDRSPVGADVDFRYALTPTSIETVIASILSDHRPTSIGGTIEGYLGGVDVTLWTPTSPLFVVDNSSGGFPVTSTKSVFQALTDLVGPTIGWFLRFAFDEARQEFRLALLDPGRSKTWSSTTDRALSKASIRKWRKLEINDDTIRNDVEVEYGNVVVAGGNQDNVGVNLRKTVRVENSASVTQWGRRYCRVGLASASQISDLTQATLLANNILGDLSSPYADIEIEVLPRRDIGLGDIVRIAGDDLRVSAGLNLDVAVVGVRHTRRRNERVTVLTGRAAKPSGRRRWWFDVIYIKGSKGLSPLSTPSSPALSAIAGGVLVGWTYPANYGNKKYLETEIHVSTTPGFTPSAATCLSVVRGMSSAVVELDPKSAQYVKILHRDEMANVSAPSPQSSLTPRFLPKAPYVNAVRTGTNQDLTTTPGVVVFNGKNGDPFGNYNSATGLWTQTKTGPVWIDAGVRFDSNAKPGATMQLGVDVNGTVVRSGAVATCNAGAAPNRCSATVGACMVYLTAGDVMKVAPNHNGNANSLILIDAATYLVISTGPHA